MRSAQDQFQAFQLDSDYKINKNYEVLLEDRRLKNLKLIDLELLSRKISKQTKYKIKERLKEIRPFLNESSPGKIFSVEDVITLYPEQHPLTRGLIAKMFAIEPNRQNTGEAYCEMCLDVASEGVSGFTWEKLSGSKSLWVDSNGEIVDKKPKDGKTKGLDYSISYRKNKIIVAQKRMKISAGGHQNNQTKELELFSGDTINTNGWIPLAILDGELSPTTISNITGRNPKIILLQSHDLLCFAKWMESKQ